MTPELRTVNEDTPLDEIVRLMERHRIKRVLVVREERLVGIVTRANLLHALASVVAETKTEDASDALIRDQLYVELKAQPWAPPLKLIDIVVRNGTVHLWGTLLDERQHRAIVVAAENIPGVKAIDDNLAWVEPRSGRMVIPPPKQSTSKVTPS
jgi:CBS-domain-containing membrane protein